MGDNGELSHEDGTDLCCEMTHLTTKSDLHRADIKVVPGLACALKACCVE